MTNKVNLEITSCKDCPHWHEERYYTADSWEHVMEWKCHEKKEEHIYYMEWNDKDPGIPSDCPLLT